MRGVIGGFAPKLYAWLDAIPFEDNADDVRALIEQHERTRFFLPDSAPNVGILPSAQVSLVRLVPGDGFSRNIHVLTDFGNFGATAIQILAILGYRRITMVGVDARYTYAEERTFVDDDGFVRLREDPNHFSDAYVRRKRLHPRPDLTKVLGKWPIVARECRRIGLEVRNASAGSALDCFPVSDFTSAVDWTRHG